ncbi:hypothetical protein JW930_01675 [Candidatus Woesearchaeota archaeon]|nr:hypothetical protein [Candidatus Woesearchaeota archaeon]
MKYLTVYYSRTGTTRVIGEAIAKELNSDIDEIIDMNQRKSLIGYLRCGMEVVMKKLPKIKDTKDASRYDLVVIGTPVWAGTMASPARTYIKNNKFKKVAFFCTQASPQPQNTFKDMEQLTRKPVAALQLTSKEVKSNKYKDKVKRFVNDIIK